MHQIKDFIVIEHEHHYILPIDLFSALVVTVIAISSLGCSPSSKRSIVSADAPGNLLIKRFYKNRNTYVLREHPHDIRFRVGRSGSI